MPPTNEVIDLLITILRCCKLRTANDCLIKKYKGGEGQQQTINFTDLSVRPRAMFSKKKSYTHR